MIIQEGDVYLFQTPDNGDINVEGGITEMAGGLETSVYISMFGGNLKDDRMQDNKHNWWGNIGEIDPDFHIRSETQFLLKSMPATVANLRKLESANLRDLQWMLDKKVATEISSVVSIPALNRVKIEIKIIARGEEHTLEFIENWKAAI